ncbi:histidine triad nucleotide-binding protein [candidate division KSB1 bacterium]|nr:histidine triad nucleotide-binding protein [candidate division KSB1 bacterium]
MSCVFCQIVKKEIDAAVVYTDEWVVAFKDIHPQASTHVLIVPKKHISTLNQLQDADAEIVGRMVLAAQKLAGEFGIAQDGYRLVMNCNSDGGQTVFHLHLHLLGGRRFHWPPG